MNANASILIKYLFCIVCATSVKKSVIFKMGYLYGKFYNKNTLYPHLSSSVEFIDYNHNLH